ncbi:MAG: tocopherol cyclase family protein [Cellulosilyticaceae bacterium]
MFGGKDMGIRTLYKPEVFQGNMNKKNYFEGYFFKLVSKNAEEIISIIPGISLDEEDPHAFIQVLRNSDGKSYYIRYPLKEFSYNKNVLFLQIGENIFTQSYIRFNITEDNLNICGIVWFDNLQTVDNKILRPGIMGPFRFFPFMECYHGIVSMNHNLKGTVSINHEPINFTGGKGYIEKDWGTNFPEAYVWIQSNNFVDPNLSVMISIARIPFMKRHFRGFLACISIEDKTRIFTTYTGAKIKQFTVKGDELYIEIKQGKERIEISMSKSLGRELVAPQKGAMKRAVHESLESTMELKIYYKERLMTHQYTSIAAIELSGDIALITKSK